MDINLEGDAPPQIIKIVKKRQRSISCELHAETLECEDFSKTEEIEDPVEESKVK